MAKTRIVWGTTLLFLALGLLLAACAGSQEPGAGGDLDGQALVEERCTVCHNLQTVTGANKSADAWQSTVERMIGNGAKLTDVEKDAVVEYLTEAYPE
jgi:hypothetical protein